MLGWVVTVLVWLIGFSRTACLIDRPSWITIWAALFWPIVSLPCLFHLPESLIGWWRNRDAS